MKSRSQNDGGIVILAAGDSSRLGFPKQTLAIDDKLLLQNAIDEALKSKIKNIIVVLGANNDDIKEKINFDLVEIVTNNDWADGIASSIVCGLHHLLLSKPKLQFATFLVCDQPFLRVEIIQSIIDAYIQKGFDLVASSYDGINGTPALFDKKYFPEILSLKGDTGAMKIIRKNFQQTFLIPFTQGVIDIDTPEDFQKFSTSK